MLKTVRYKPLLGGVLMLAILCLAACATHLSPREAALRTWRERWDAKEAWYMSPHNHVTSDSGLVFVYGMCIRYTFDSGRGLLIRDAGSSVDPNAPHHVQERIDTARVTLTPDEMRTILSEADRIGLWSYPSVLTDSMSIDWSATSTGGAISPSNRYRIDLRWKGRAVSVRWTDHIVGPLTEQAAALRALGYWLQASLEDKQPVRELPDPGLVCI